MEARNRYLGTFDERLATFVSGRRYGFVQRLNGEEDAFDPYEKAIRDTSGAADKVDSYRFDWPGVGGGVILAVPIITVTLPRSLYRHHLNTDQVCRNRKPHHKK